VTDCGHHQATLPSRSPSTPAVAAVVRRASSPTASTGTTGLEHGTHIGRAGDVGVLQTTHAPLRRRDCASESQGAALRTKAVSLAHPSDAQSTLSVLATRRWSGRALSGPQPHPDGRRARGPACHGLQPHHEALRPDASGRGPRLTGADGVSKASARVTPLP